MFPKNAMVYMAAPEFKFDFEKLEDQLTEFKIKPLGEQDKQKFGWTNPFTFSETLIHQAENFVMLTAKREEKTLPASVVNERMNERVDALEELEGRPLRKREKDAIKEDVLIDLLPHAFPKSAITHIFINTNSNLIYVDSSTPKKAEDALALLRKTIGSLPVIPVIPNEPIDYTLTHWLKDDATPSGFTFSDSVKFESVMDNGGIATFRSQDLASDEIKACLDAEKVVVEAVLNWQDRLDFKLTSAGALKALKFSSELRDQNDDIPREDAAARIDADFILACGELEAFFSALYTSLGGVENLTLKEQSEVETSSAGIESVSITSGSTTIKLTRDDVQKLKKVARELDGELDSLFAEARKHVAETRRASVANLQRKFKIGYNRAALIMEQLEITGCVSAHQSNGGREVLIAPQEAK